MISPALIEVARIEGLCEPLDQAVLVSAKFVAGMMAADIGSSRAIATLCAPQGAERGLRDGFWALGIYGPSSKASGFIKNAKPQACREVFTAIGYSASGVELSRHVCASGKSMERVVRVWRRRAFPCLVLGILAIPLLAHVFLPQAAQSDNRVLARSPGVPRNISAFVNWPQAADAYLKDHFGFRAQLIRVYNAFNWRVLGISTDPHVVVGRNGRLFLSDVHIGNPVLLGDCGAWWPDKDKSAFAGEAAVAMRRLQSDFPQFRVFIVPTSDVLYPAELPEWVQRACAGKTPLVEDWMSRLPPGRARAHSLPNRDSKTSASSPGRSLDTGA